MSSYTTNLQLYKADPETDQNDTFNINTMLNDNWDKLDQKFGNVATATELNEVKKSVSDGKKNVANAITSMGVTTATDAEFQTMATNIKKIDTLSSVPHQGAEGTLNGYKYFNSNKTLSISTTEGEKVGLPDNVSGINEWIVGYGNGMYVAVANDSASSAYSTDGINWTVVPNNLPGDYLWDSIAYGNGRFIVKTGSTSSAYIYSTDGINWTVGSQEFPASTYWGPILYGNGVFVVPSTKNAYVARSTDGVSWTKVTTPSTGSDKFAYGNGRFIMLNPSGDNVGRVMYSSDGGASWEEKTFTSSDPISNMPYSSTLLFADNKFVLVGTNTVCFSADGVTWELKNISNAELSGKKIAYNNGVFFAVSISSDHSKYIAHYSYDAIDWISTELPYKPIYTTAEITNVTYTEFLYDIYPVGDKFIISSYTSTNSSYIQGQEYLCVVKIQENILVGIPDKTYIDDVQYVKVKSDSVNVGGGSGSDSGGTDIKLQEKSVSPSESKQTVKPDSGYDGLSQVSVSAIQTETKTVTSNGTVTPSTGKYLKSVVVNVQQQSSTPNLQTKSVTPSETAQTVSADSGYDGLSSVEVGAISKTYVGSGVARLEASDYTPSTRDITIGANQYLTGTQTIKAVPTETKTITTNGTHTPSTGKFFSSVTVSVPSGGDDSGSGDGLPDVIVAGDTPILASWTGKTVSTNTITDTGLSITIPKDGTYRLYIPATKGSGMTSSGNPTITVYKNGVKTDNVVSVTSTAPTAPYSVDVECAEGDVIGLYATGYKASYSTTSVTVMALIACIDK